MSPTIADSFSVATQPEFSSRGSFGTEIRAARALARNRSLKKIHLALRGQRRSMRQMRCVTNRHMCLSGQGLDGPSPRSHSPAPNGGVHVQYIRSSTTYETARCSLRAVGRSSSHEAIGERCAIMKITSTRFAASHRYPSCSDAPRHAAPSSGARPNAHDDSDLGAHRGRLARRVVRTGLRAGYFCTASDAANCMWCSRGTTRQ